MNRYRLTDYYDVWGNPIDGFDVNDVIVTDIIIDISETDSDYDVVTKLKSAGYFVPTASTDDIGVDFEPERIELYRKYDCYPIGCLVLQKNNQ